MVLSSTICNIRKFQVITLLRTNKHTFPQCKKNSFNHFFNIQSKKESCKRVKKQSQCVTLSPSKLQLQLKWSINKICETNWVMRERLNDSLVLNEPIKHCIKLRTFYPHRHPTLKELKYYLQSLADKPIYRNQVPYLWDSLISQHLYVLLHPFEFVQILSSWPNPNDLRTTCKTVNRFSLLLDIIFLSVQHFTVEQFCMSLYHFWRLDIHPPIHNITTILAAWAVLEQPKIKYNKSLIHIDEEEPIQLVNQDVSVSNISNDNHPMCVITHTEKDSLISNMQSIDEDINNFPYFNQFSVEQLSFLLYYTSRQFGVAELLLRTLYLRFSNHPDTLVIGHSLLMILLGIHHLLYVIKSSQISPFSFAFNSNNLFQNLLHVIQTFLEFIHHRVPLNTLDAVPSQLTSFIEFTTDEVYYHCLLQLYSLQKFQKQFYDEILLNKLMSFLGTQHLVVWTCALGALYWLPCRLQMTSDNIQICNQYLICHFQDTPLIYLTIQRFSRLFPVSDELRNKVITTLCHSSMTQIQCQTVVSVLGTTNHHEIDVCTLLDHAIVSGIYWPESSEECSKLLSFFKHCCQNELYKKHLLYQHIVSYKHSFHPPCFFDPYKDKRTLMSHFLNLHTQ